MWFLCRADECSDELADLLNQGYEPFGITREERNGDGRRAPSVFVNVVWLRHATPVRAEDTTRAEDVDCFGNPL